MGMIFGEERGKEIVTWAGLNTKPICSLRATKYISIYDPILCFVTFFGQNVLFQWSKFGLPLEEDKDGPSLIH